MTGCHGFFYIHAASWKARARLPGASSWYQVGHTCTPPSWCRGANEPGAQLDDSCLNAKERSWLPQKGRYAGVSQCVSGWATCLVKGLARSYQEHTFSLPKCVGLHEGRAISLAYSAFYPD